MTSAETPATMTAGQYLAARLSQLGVRHLFGLPGDFNLTLLDHMLEGGELEWVGAANELNAAYAADGYARASRGPSAVVTTLGVGELSAINGIAGAFAEDVPVISIVGTATTSAIERGALLHHTVGDGDFERFLRASREVTAAAELLGLDRIGETIDRVLTVAITEFKPVYLAVPADVAIAPVDAARLSTPLVATASDADALEQFESLLASTLAGHETVTILAGPRVHRPGLEGALRALADVPGVRVASQSGSKAIVDESHPHSLGTYIGALTPSAAAREAVDEAHPIVLAGAVLSDLLTGGFTHEFDERHAIDLGLRDARIGAARFDGIALTDTLAALTRVTQALGLEDPPATELVTPDPPLPEAGAPLTQEGFWAAIQRWLAPGTMVIADAGTAFYGALGLSLPDDCDLMGQPLWSSIGFTIPATLGVEVANVPRRTALFVGDGAAQLTVQELATVLRRGHTPVIFLLNNDGYTVERVIQNPDAVYQDVTSWDWARLPAALAPGVPVEARRVTTGDELAAALQAATAVTDRAVFIEVILPRDDAPALLAQIGAGLSAANKKAE